VEVNKLLFQQKKSLKAIETFYTILKHDSTNVYAWNFLGYIFTQQRKKPEAVKFFLKALKYDPSNAYALKMLTSLACEEKLDHKAKKIYLIILKHDPTNEYALTKLAILLFKQKEYIEAEKLYRTGLRINPTNPNFLNNLGYLYYKQKRYSEAKKAYQNNLKYNPTHIHTIDNLATLYLDQGEFICAKQTYQTALIHLPNNERLWTKLGVLLATSLQNFSEAKEAFQKALRCDFGNINAWINLAVFYLQLKELDIAEKLMRTRLKYNPNQPKLLTCLGTILTYQRKFPEAIEKYRTALKYDPHNTIILSCLGGAYQLSGNYRRSKITLKKALKHKSPKFLKHRSAKSVIHQLYRNLGNTLVKLGQFRQARKAFLSAKDFREPEISEIGYSITLPESPESLPPPTTLIITANSDYT
jgi:tetratricopeptide (TPR) repeat protein